MAESKDEMMEWVLGEVGEGGECGLSIEVLFQKFDDSFANGDSAQLWQMILVSKDVELGDARSSAALRKLALSDVLALGLGDKKIKVKGREDALAKSTPVAPEEEFIKVPTPDARSIPAPPLSAPTVAPVKRRGRPPKVKDGTQFTASSRARRPFSATPSLEEAQQAAGDNAQPEAQAEAAIPPHDANASTAPIKRRGRPRGGVKKAVTSAVSNMTNVFSRMATRRSSKGDTGRESSANPFHESPSSAKQNTSETPIPTPKARISRRTTKSKQVALVTTEVPSDVANSSQRFNSNIVPESGEDASQLAVLAPEIPQSATPKKTSSLISVAHETTPTKVLTQNSGRTIPPVNVSSSHVTNRVEDGGEAEDEVDLIQYLDHNDTSGTEITNSPRNCASTAENTSTVPVIMTQKSDGPDVITNEAGCNAIQKIQDEISMEGLVFRNNKDATTKSLDDTAQSSDNTPDTRIHDSSAPPTQNIGIAYRNASATLEWAKPAPDVVSTTRPPAPDETVETQALQDDHGQTNTEMIVDHQSLVRTRVSRRLSGRNQDAPTTLHPISDTAKRIPEAKFTSYQELQYQKGVSGVYMDLLGTQHRKANSTGRNKLSSVALFKSEKLKDAQWLENNKNSWSWPLAQARAKNQLNVLDSRTAGGRERKRPRNTEDSTPADSESQAPKKRKYTRASRDAKELAERHTSATSKAAAVTSAAPPLIHTNPLASPRSPVGMHSAISAGQQSHPKDLNDPPTNLENTPGNVAAEVTETETDTLALISNPFLNQNTFAKNILFSQNTWPQSGILGELAKNTPNPSPHIHKRTRPILNTNAQNMNDATTHRHPDTTTLATLQEPPQPVGTVDQSTADSHSAHSHPNTAAPDRLDQPTQTLSASHRSTNDAPTAPVPHPHCSILSAQRLSSWLPGRIADPLLQRQQTEAQLQSYKSPFAPLPTPASNQTQQPSDNSPLPMIPSLAQPGPSPEWALSSQSHGVPTAQGSHSHHLSYTSGQEAAYPLPNPHTHPLSSQPHKCLWDFAPNEPVPESIAISQAQRIPTPNSHFDQYRTPPPSGTLSREPISSGPRRGSFSADPASLDPQAQALRDEFFTPKPVPPVAKKTPGQSDVKKPTKKRKISALSPEEPHAEAPPPKRKALPGLLHDSATSSPKKPGAPSAWAARRQMDAGMASDISKAQLMVFPKDIARLASVHNGEAGNLLLSPDKSVLEFLGIRQHPPQLPVFTLPVSELVHHPITSAKGSKPMCIRLKVKDDSDADIVHLFKIAQTDDAYTAMNKMRASIVAAMILIRFQNNDDYEEAEREIRKPFKCDGCGARFKNKGGLDYHLTKSNTTCNPSFDPSTIKKKPGRVRNESKPPKAAGMPKSKAPKPSPAKRKAPEIENPQVEDHPDSSSSSEDSIYEWAQSIATKGLQREFKKTYVEAPPPKLYRSLPGEMSLLESIAENLANNPQDHNTENALVAKNSAHSIIKPTIMTKNLSDEACEQVLVGIIAGNNGIFPGDRGIWYALVAAWIKDYSSSEILPESKFCTKILDKLIDSRMLRKTEFPFRDAKSRNVTRSIILAPNFDPDSRAFDMMKELVKEAHPGYYVPSQFAPPEPILARLEALDRRGIGRPSLERDDEGDELSSSLASESSDDSRGRQETVSSDDDDELLLEESGAIDSPIDINENFEESDEDLYTERRRSGRRQAKSETWKQQQSRTMAGWHAKRKAARIAPSLSSRSLRASGSAPHRQQTWEPALTFMPNPTTGAWDSAPVEIEKPVRKRQIVRRPGMAEPITFMQAPSGAWSQRPFGHGAKPIYARPSRRADGNPHLEDYLKRIEKGFRPIIYPTKNRMFLPAAPSKRLLTGQQLPVSRKKRKMQAKVPDVLPDDEDPDFLVPDDEGMPDREYTMRFPRRVSTLSAVRDMAEDASNEIPKRRTRNSTRAAKNSGADLDEVDILNFFEPKKLLPGGPQNPGLTTVPSSFGLIRPDTSMPGENSSDQVEPYIKIIFVEPKIIAADSDFWDGSWMVEGVTADKQAYVSVRYDDETAFTVETLPYEQLDIGEDVSEYQKQPHRRRKNIAPRFTGSIVSRTKRLTATRPLTALPVDFEGVMDDPKDAAKEFGAQIAAPTEGEQMRKRFRAGNRMSTEAESRFIVAVVVIRTVTGGLDQYIDWVLVSNFFPEYSLNYLSRLWANLYGKKKNLIDELVVDFQDAFLVAYKSGALPSIDFNNLVGYDWPTLIDWTMTNVNTTLANKTVPLPASRKELKRTYHYNELDREDNNIQETFFGLLGPVYKRIEAIASMPNAIPIVRHARTRVSEGDEVDDLMLAKSWARATALTPAEDWDSTIAKSKLSQLGLDLVEKALDTLKEEKVIIQRARNRANTGRSYEGSDIFASTLRKQVVSKTYADAYKYKQFLDAEFRAGKEYVRADYMGNEGSFMAVSSLLASGRVTLKGIDIPMNKWGLGDEDTGYETKKIPKSRLRWEIDIHPTSTYIFDEDNINLQNLQWVEPPRGTQGGELPVWYGITDTLIADLWRRVLVAVGGTVALRSGISNKGLRRVFKPTLEEWEIKLLMEWGEMMGFFERLEDGVDGWAVGEWWWIMVGKVCADQEAQAHTNAENEDEVEVYDV